MRNRFLCVLALLCLLGTGVRGQEEEVPDAQPGPTPWADPESNTGALRDQITTGGSYSAASGCASRIVNDLQVPDALGPGLDFTRYWNSCHNEETDLAAQWPVDFGASGWSHSWRWNAVYDEQLPDMENDPPPHTSFTSITITFPDGHATKFKVARTNAGGNPYPRVGPPYDGEHETTLWPKPGDAVHDRVAEMTADGREFWLYRADGGAVHFVGVYAEYHTGHAWWHYQATEVYDPYGFRTNLFYDEYMRLSRVEQEGGRSLILTWGWLGGQSVITKVETGGPAAGQEVNYYYYRKLPAATGAYTLAQVRYQNEPVLGQTTSAYYVYNRAFGDDPNGPLSDFPVLKRADDPHFAGAMTKIRYAYRGVFCPVPFWPEDNPPPHFYSRFYFTGHAISEERSGESGTTGTMVSRFYSTCLGGRSEENGIGGLRTFYFGDLANDPEVDTILGYQLTKVTDFGGLNGPPASRKQAGGSQPGKVWDGRNKTTNFEYLDQSGSPSKAIYMDGSTCLYDRTNRGPSEPPDDNRIHNKQRHWLFSKKDENEQVTVYKRDNRRRVTDIFYHNSAGTQVASESYTYNDLNQVTSHRLPSDATQHYEYDGQNRLEREYNSVDRALHGLQADRVYTYDALGRVATMTDGRARNSTPPALFSEKMTYNGRHLVTSVEYPGTGGGSNPTVRYEYDRYGNRTAVINELGHRKDYTYDSYRRCTSMTEQLNAPGWDGNGTVPTRRWNWIYDRVIEDANGNPGPSILASAHTSKEWRIQIEPEFNDLHHRRATSRTFDVNNRMLSEQTGQIQLPGEPLGTLHTTLDTETHHFTYDENGQKSSYKDPRERITRYAYNNRNRLETTTEPQREGQPVPVTRIDYDFVGNKTQITFPDTKTQRWDNYDPFGQAWTFFDEYNRPTDLIYCWGPMKKLYKVNAHRDSEDQWTEFGYDLMGRPTKTIFPDTTTEESTYKFGQLDTFKTRRNQWKRLHYDARGREDYHTWDNSAAPGIARVWDDANRLTSIANVFSTIDYGYDDAGQVKWEGNEIAGTGRRVTGYCRFPSGEVSRVSYPSEFVAQRKYTARGQLQRSEWAGGSVDYVYLPDGKVDFENYGNGVQSDLGYDGRGFINMSKTFRGNQTYAQRDYWRDTRDRIEGWKKGNDVAANPMENGRGDRYGYDAEGQLTMASYQVQDPVNNSNGAQRADLFHYDWLGNRVGGNIVASRGWMGFTRRPDNGLNQYHSWENGYPNPPQHWGSGMFYDDNVPPPSPVPENYPYVFPGNGVLMQDGWITGGFNALNQPVGIWSFNYWTPPGIDPNWMFFGHDPLGRCVKRWVTPHVDGHAPPPETNPATYFYYDGWNLIQEGPNGSVAERTYVHGNRVDEIVASVAAGAGWLYHHYDARGHCILQTNASGGLQEQYDYDAFGWPYFYTATGAPARVNGKPGSPSGNRFLFTGREWIKDLKLYDYRARMYQPELGRFLQPDPTGFEAGDYNVYRYCHNDPINRVDPMGLFDDTWNRQMLWQGGGDGTVTEMVTAIHRQQQAVGLVERAIENAGSQSGAKATKIDNGLKIFNVPGGVTDLENVRNEYSANFPKYPKPQPIIAELRRALKEGRIQAGLPGDFYPGNPMTTRNGVVLIDTQSRISGAKVASLLAHEGQHLADRNFSSLFMRERRAFDAQYGFGRVLGLSDRRKTDADIHRDYGY